MQSTGSVASGAVFSQQPSALVAAHEALEAEYVRRWQIEIEQFGNSAYPDTAKRFGNGNVRLRVKVDLDGNLQDIQVLSTSGIAALDRAAIETVERLAPFDAFPTALANSVAELDIIRTWQFRY
jgi:TonB family protein